MKENILLLLLILSLTGLKAQSLSVSSFKKDGSDMAARVTDPVTDQNGDKCALIKIRTTQEGFAFEGDMLGIVKVQQKIGEICLYVPAKAKRITLKHRQLGVASYTYRIPIEEATVYIMELTAGEVVTTVINKEAITQWVIITSIPDTANVYLNEKLVGKTPYQKKWEVGEYSYRIEKSNYHNNAGKFILADSTKTILGVNLVPNYGNLNITSQPEEGMEILLDGKPTGKITPAHLYKIPSGKHTLSLVHDMYQQQTQGIEIFDRQTTELNLKMLPVFSSLTILGTEGSQVFIDNMLQGTVPFSTRLLEAYYTIETKLDKHVPKTRQYRAYAGKNDTLVLNPLPRTGTLEVVTNPYGASIFLDGKKYGITPETIEDVLIGSYTLELQKEGFGTLSKQINIEENQTIALDEALQNYIEVVINSTPAGAFVYSGDKLLGTTPLKHKVMLGEETITIKKEGYTELNKTFNVTSNDEVRFQLEKLKLWYNVESNVEKAMVYIDGDYKGTTPVNFYLEKGSYVIRVEKAGYKTAKYTAVVPENNSFYAFLKEKGNSNSSTSRDKNSTQKSKGVTPLGMSYIYASNGIATGHKVGFDLYNFLYYTFQFPANQLHIENDVHYDIVAHEIGLKFNIRFGRNVSLAPICSYILEKSTLTDDIRYNYPETITAELLKLGCEFNVYLTQKSQIFIGYHHMYDYEYIEENGEQKESATYDEYFSGRTGGTWVMGIRLGLGKLRKRK